MAFPYEFLEINSSETSDEDMDVVEVSSSLSPKRKKMKGNIPKRQNKMHSSEEKTTLFAYEQTGSSNKRVRRECIRETSHSIDDGEECSSCSSFHRSARANALEGLQGVSPSTSGHCKISTALELLAHSELFRKNRASCDSQGCDCDSNFPFFPEIKKSGPLKRPAASAPDETDIVSPKSQKVFASDEGQVAQALQGEQFRQFQSQEKLVASGQQTARACWPHPLESEKLYSHSSAKFAESHPTYDPRPAMELDPEGRRMSFTRYASLAEILRFSEVERAVRVNSPYLQRTGTSPTSAQRDLYTHSQHQLQSHGPELRASNFQISPQEGQSLLFHTRNTSDRSHPGNQLR